MSIRIVLVALLMTFGSPQHRSLGPVFLGIPSCSHAPGGSLICDGMVGGLGPSTTTVVVQADAATALYACLIQGNYPLPGPPVTTGSITGIPQQLTPQGGQITFVATLGLPPPPPTTQECPGMAATVKLVFITYMGVVLHIQQPAGTDVLSAQFGTIDARVRGRASQASIAQISPHLLAWRTEHDDSPTAERPCA